MQGWVWGVRSGERRIISLRGSKNENFWILVSGCYHNNFSNIFRHIFRVVGRLKVRSTSFGNISRHFFLGSLKIEVRSEVGEVRFFMVTFLSFIGMLLGWLEGRWKREGEEHFSITFSAF